MKEPKIFNERNLTEKVHYVYRVTIDNKYYIGKRTGFLNDLVTGAYTTSSKLIHEKLQNGLHFSKIKILQVFSSPKDALNFEKRILIRVKAKTNPKFLNQHNGSGDFSLRQHTEKAKDKMSKSQSNRWDEYTESGQQNRENMSKIKIEFYKTERGMKTRENHSEFMKENGKNIAQKRAETLIQKRKDASILGELMFDEEFIKENFLITDDKSEQRNLCSVYSKLSGFSISHIALEKRIGKLSFLHGIKSIIKFSVDEENAKIKEIETIIKSRNNEKE